MITDRRKILLTFPFWQGDKREMSRLLRFLTQIEPGMSDLADVLLIARYDCTVDPVLVREVSSRFHVHHTVCRRHGSGHPFGCNEVFFGTADWVFEQREAERIPDYKAWMTFESDSCPILPNYTYKLSEAWDEANTYVLGPFQTSPAPHVNGNCLYSTDRDFMHRLSREISGCAPNLAYDMVLFKEWERWGYKDCPIMKSWWNYREQFPQEQFDAFVKEGVAFFHGVKNDSVQRCFSQRWMK